MRLHQPIPREASSIADSCFSRHHFGKRGDKHGRPSWKRKRKRS